MSAKIKPSFTVDGKTYVFEYSRALQLEYKKLVAEKQNDSEYQRQIAELARLQEEDDTLQNSYKKARQDWLNAPLDEDKKSVYKALKAEYEETHKELSEYVATHDVSVEADNFTLYMLGKLTLLALQTQYELNEKQAEDVWNKYVADVGEIGAMEWLAAVAGAWFTNVDEDTENPFIKATRAKAEQEQNRKLGMTKIKK
jgi:hypothetical protein